MRLSRALWLIPPFLGACFYAAGSAMTHHEDAGGRSRGRRSSSLALPAATAGLNRQQLDDALKEVAVRGREQIRACDPAQLKTLIAKLLLQTQPAGQEMRSENSYLDEALDRLGALEKGAALAWVMEHDPKGLRTFLQGWAKTDPAGAFETILHSPVSNPCSTETLSGILQSFADRSPESLREACRRVPWGLFSPPGRSSPDLCIVFTDGSNLRPWIESGVLVELRDQGVDVRSPFCAWMEQDPREALAQWKDGKGPDAEPDRSLMVLLLAMTRSDKKQEATLAAMAEMSNEDRERISSIVTEAARKDPMNEWEKYFPSLIRPQMEESEGP